MTQLYKLLRQLPITQTDTDRSGLQTESDEVSK
jgi:hypothetical protein